MGSPLTFLLTVATAIAMVKGWVSSAPSNVQLAQNLAQNTVGMPAIVQEAMAAVDRAHYCRSDSGVGPYEDRPQLIGFGVTISAPHMHAHALTMLAPFILGAGASSSSSSSPPSVRCGQRKRVLRCVRRRNDGAGRAPRRQWSGSVGKSSIRARGVAEGNARRDGRGAALDDGTLELRVGDGSGLPSGAPRRDSRAPLRRRCHSRPGAVQGGRLPHPRRARRRRPGLQEDRAHRRASPRSRRAVRAADPREAQLARR